MTREYIPERWPVLDYQGRRVEHLCVPNIRIDQVPQGRAFRDGEWLPWTNISAMVYENRRTFPRKGYEIRLAYIGTKEQTC